jgi:hypothetical protein
MFNFLVRTKLITHKPSGIDLPEDPAFPYKVDVALSPPKFMDVAFMLRFGGTERIVIQGKGLWSLNRAMKKQDDLRRHPRLLRYTITGPDGVIEQYPNEAAQAA